MPKKLPPDSEVDKDPVYPLISFEEEKALIQSMNQVEMEGTSVTAKKIDIERNGGDFEPFEPHVRTEMEKILSRLIYLMGLDRVDPNLKETPRRITDLLEEFSQHRSLADVLGNGFDNQENGDNGMVMQQGIPFRSLCMHHFCPFYGTAAIGYLPRKKVVGLSKLTRLIQAAGTLQPSTQEVITNNVADVLHKWSEALGVIVVTEAAHTCMSVRGVNTPNVITTVSACRGVFLTNFSARAEFLGLLNRK